MAPPDCEISFSGQLAKQPRNLHLQGAFRTYFDTAVTSETFIIIESRSPAKPGNNAGWIDVDSDVTKRAVIPVINV